MSRSPTIKTTLDQYQLYLNSYLTNINKFQKLMENNRQWRQQSNYGCLCCKEIDQLYTLTGHFNSTFRPINQSQLQTYPPIKNKQHDLCLFAIFSMESTTEMIEHNQYLIPIILTSSKDEIIQCQFGEIIQVTFNLYDPILSNQQMFTQTQYIGYYQYQNSTEKITHQRQCFYDAIEIDANQSLPIEFQDYLNFKWITFQKHQKLEEIHKIFPFLTLNTIKDIVKSKTKTRIFIYCKCLLSDYLNNLISNALTFQDFRPFSELFVRLSENDIQILNRLPKEQQYSTFCKLIQSPTRSLLYFELIDFTINNLLTKNIISISNEICHQLIIQRLSTIS